MRYGKQLRVEYVGANTMYWNHLDHLGTARAVTDKSGLLLMRKDYYTFGEEWTQSSNDERKFTGYYRDAELGLDYAVHRYYGSQWGRFLTPDPGPYSLSKPQSWNRYSYVFNDPVNMTDPRGLVPCGGASGVRPDGTFYAEVFDCITFFPTGAAGFIYDPEMYRNPMQEIYESGNCGMSTGESCYPVGWQRVLDGVQNVLGLAGLFPGVGEILDLLNALVSFGRGNTTDGLLSLAAMLPVGGQAATAAKLFRQNLIKHTGLELSGKHAHHILPLKFMDKFSALGLNVNDPKFGAWWDARDHLRNAWGYNSAWDDWFSRNPGATADDVLTFAKELGERYGLPFTP